MPAFIRMQWSIDNMSYTTYNEEKQGSDITRVLYFFFIGKRAILTNGFVKKTQKTPPAAIELARKYKADYERRFGR